MFLGPVAGAFERFLGNQESYWNIWGARSLRYEDTPFEEVFPPPPTAILRQHGNFFLGAGRRPRRLRQAHEGLRELQMPKKA